MFVRYLHLSDLHFTSAGAPEWTSKAFNQNVVTSSMLEKIAELVSPETSFDFIVISGDIADKAKREEYEVAEDFCKSLLDITKVEPARLYVVPGNHDVNRSQVDKLHIDTFYQFDSQDKINEILNNALFAPAIHKKFENFNNFAQNVTGRCLFDGRSYHFVETLSLQKQGAIIRLNIVGLNSALFSGYDGDDKQKLALGLTQADAALRQLDSDVFFSLAVFHHPFACFHPDDKVCENQLTRKIDLILHGHLHDPANAVLKNQAGEAVIIAAGASFETRQSENSFNIVQIDVTTGKGQIEFYKYLHNKNSWNKNYDVNDTDKQGLFTFNLALPETPPLIILPSSGADALQSGEISDDVPPSIARQITFIHDYLLPVSFSGRLDEIERIKQILVSNIDSAASNNQVSIIAVTAVGGVGKSCLVRKAVESVLPELSYQKIFWFSFDEARTEDSGYFFRKILEKLDESADTLNDLKTKELYDKLCEKIDAAPILCILDGFEAIQNTFEETTPAFGRIAEDQREIYRFLRHLCNQKQTRAVVTSRVNLSEFTGMVGYTEMLLETFSPETGAALLSAMGVEGNAAELEKCSKVFGGHALCLVAAGKYMARNHIGAAELERVVGNPRIFSRNSEGERVAKIVEVYRRDLTAEQEYFLTMLSIHPRPVSPENFPVLVENYVTNESLKNSFPGNLESRNDYNGEAHDEFWVRENIIEPLHEKGLIDLRRDSNGTLSYSAHPLMKVAYMTWMNKDEKIIAHEVWAKSAQRSPGWFEASSSAANIEQLQIVLDALDHYLNAGNYRVAWDICWSTGYGIFNTLDNLNYGNRQLEIAKQFETAVENKKVNFSFEEKCRLYDVLARAYSKKGEYEQQLLCRHRYYEVAQNSGREHYIEDGRKLLALTYLRFGNIDEARALNPSSKYEQGMLELFTGNYETAIPFLKEEFEGRYGHFKTVCGTFFAEALIRAGRLREAEDVLKKSLYVARTSSPKLQCCMKDHLLRLIKLKLKEGDVKLARQINDEWRESFKETDVAVPGDYQFLLVAEGDYDSVIKSAEKELSTSTGIKLNKNNEITTLIVLALAYYGKEDIERSRDYLSRAEDMMNSTKCWREKDRFELAKGLIL